MSPLERFKTALNQYHGREERPVRPAPMSDFDRSVKQINDKVKHIAELLEQETAQKTLKFQRSTLPVGKAMKIENELDRLLEEHVMGEHYRKELAKQCSLCETAIKCGEIIWLTCTHLQHQSCINYEENEGYLCGCGEMSEGITLSNLEAFIEFLSGW